MVADQCIGRSVPIRQSARGVHERGAGPLDTADRVGRPSGRPGGMSVDRRFAGPLLHHVADDPLGVSEQHQGIRAVAEGCCRCSKPGVHAARGHGHAVPSDDDHAVDVGQELGCLGRSGWSCALDSASVPLDVVEILAEGLVQAAKGGEGHAERDEADDNGAAADAERRAGAP